MLILACYIASYNPTKSDVRIFGRDASGLPKRKNRGYAKGKGKVSTSKVCSFAAPTNMYSTDLFGAKKIPQKLLGPVAFALERMLAILEALTLEYVDFPGLDDAYEREDTANLETSRARTLSDVSSVSSSLQRSLYSLYGRIPFQLAQLVLERRVVRTGTADSIACSSTFKCNIGFEEVEQIATSLRVPINDLLWDPENQ